MTKFKPMDQRSCPLYGYFFIAKIQQGSSILLTSEVPQRNCPRIAAFCSANRPLIEIRPIIENIGETVIEELNDYSSTGLAE